MPSKKSAMPSKKSAGTRRSTSTGARKTAASKPRTSASEHSARILTDHDEIRNWAEERGAVPSCVKGTGSRKDVGMIRLDFPGYSGEDSLQQISWDEWFEKFDENNLSLLAQDSTADGEKSNFNKLVKRNRSEERPRTRTAR